MYFKTPSAIRGSFTQQGLSPGIRYRLIVQFCSMSDFIHQMRTKFQESFLLCHLKKMKLSAISEISDIHLQSRVESRFDKAML